MYSLWLIPDNHTFQKLNKLIVDLSTQHNTPKFEPHVTLLSGIIDNADIAIEKTQKLAEQFDSISAALTNIEYLELFYKCLFFRTDDSQGIFEMREAAEELFEHTQVNPFVPHVSFLYGALPIFEKKEIIAQLDDHFFVDFNMTKLQLVKTQLTPDHWKVLEEVELN
ncbi:MAG: haloacid dehalogenase [Aureispira sp.]|nr:haloacid dehalogenase [Aureispira sp.]